MLTDDTARRWLFVQIDTRPQVASSLAQLVEAAGPAITEQAMTQLQRAMPSHPDHPGYEHWTAVGWDDYIAVAAWAEAERWCPELPPELVAERRQLAIDTMQSGDEFDDHRENYQRGWDRW